MRFTYEDLLSFVAVCNCLNALDYEFKVSWCYIEKGRIEFYIDVELEDLNVL